MAGFDKLLQIERQDSQTFEFVSILDADVFPEEYFYERLLRKFERLPKLGIASGVLQYELMGNRKRPDRLPRRWARGGLRVWRRKCFDEAPYAVSTSADAVSSRSGMDRWGGSVKHSKIP